MNSLRLPLPTETIMDEQSKLGHAPVMLREVLRALSPQKNERFLDCTFGGGGYARAILQAVPCSLWAIDRDFAAIKRGYALRKQLMRADGTSPLHMLNGSFGQMASLCKEAHVENFDGIVMDLGVSSYQIDDPARGFSFKMDGPLDMRMGQNQRSAADIVNEASEGELADIFHFYGEERFARRVARAVVKAREEAPITTTYQLAQLVRKIIPAPKHGRIDPATRVFQGLRIAVNDELKELEHGLEDALSLLAPGGRLVVVSFHSLEDRIVKNLFRLKTKQHTGRSRYAPPMPEDVGENVSEYRLINRKILTPAEDEIQANPRARSAKLRGIYRVNDSNEHTFEVRS